MRTSGANKGILHRITASKRQKLHHTRAFFFGHVLHGKVDAAHLVDFQDLDDDLVADLQNVLDLVDALLRDLRDVDAALLAGDQLDKAAARDDGDDPALEDLAGLHVVDDRLNDADRLLDHGQVGAADRYAAVVLDISDCRNGVFTRFLDGASGQIVVHFINIASPKEKNLYFSWTASW